MREAVARAGRRPCEFDYLEAHATGTEVGDRIEGNAIAEAFGDAERPAALRLSSVKSNVGHMEAAAFHCALLKVVLMMQRRTFAPISKSYRTSNPEIDFESCPMQVQTECEPFPAAPVVVGINSFGFGGANGHCVLREYRRSQPTAWSRPLAPDAGYLVPLSARTAKSLVESADRLRRFLETNTADIYTVAGNLGCRRTQFATRAAFAVRSLPDLEQKLDEFVESGHPISSVADGERRLVFVFAGQGTQWAGCGSSLYDSHPVFRRVVDAIDKHWVGHADFSLRDASFSAAQWELDQVRLAQPSIFMIQCALVELLKTWGIYPDCVVGHSSGEVAAAYASGALSLQEATRLVFHRATLQQRTEGSGRMLAVGLDRRGMELLLKELVVPAGDGEAMAEPAEFACENSPANTVICGRESDLQPVIEVLDGRNIQNTLIPGNIAFHSTAMEAIKDDALAAFSFLDECSFKADIPFISSVTGLETERLDSSYWWSNIRQPVRFAAAIDTIIRNHEPHMVLELAPHSALQPIIQQCVEGSQSPIAAIPTLMRETDERLAIHEALGALYRAGAPIDFKSQFPRPVPIAHLLPGHPREEQKTVDSTLDDEFFQRRNDYSHGPLVGHLVPCDHLLFEARLSEAAFPWLAEHRVHHAPILPAAGFIELILQAMEGVPLVIETLEFLQPCPIPRTPVRLQTEIQPMDSIPGEFTFTISTLPYDVDAESELHSRGKFHLIGPEQAPDVPVRIREIDTSRFEPLAYAADDEIYERFETVLGETFQYGPYFRNMRRLQRDLATDNLLFDVEVDETLWQEGQAEGYVSLPALLDGGLQSFLYDLMLGADYFAIPRRAENVCFLRAPTVPRLTCLVSYPDNIRYEVDDKGQYSVPTGEWVSGSISCYDGETGDLVLHIEKYISFISNPRRADLPSSKHQLTWQPKFASVGTIVSDRFPDGEIKPSNLLSALEESGDGGFRVCHALEFAGCREPEETVLHRCVDHLSGSGLQSEYWLISEDSEITRKHYEAFGGHTAALRFDTISASGPRESALDAGLLRRNAAEMLFLHSDGVPFTTEDWEFWRQVAVPGGLALVSHPNGSMPEPGAGWTTLRTGRDATLLGAPAFNPDDEAVAESLPGPRLVLGEPQSLAAEWVSRLDDPHVHLLPHQCLTSRGSFDLEAFPQMADTQAIDIFFDRDPTDPTGERAVTEFVAFMQSLFHWRIRHANCLCRVTVVTRKSTHDTEDPRGCALWGAVRTMAVEIGQEAQLDFRLVDLSSESDIEVLAWLAGHDLRERELAVHDGRLWVPRIIGNRVTHPQVAAGEDPAYRLFLESAGQVSGLLMKTCELPALVPHAVEIDVTAAALNFRDVMVTLGLLPALAYERSALGREVGMEASGVIRRVGSSVKALEPGDQVIFVGGGLIANRVVVEQHRVFAKPACLDMEEAAASLSVYTTAYYALIHLARLRKGQRVLIHSAMGGVGQAAIALAKNAGAEVYATAGSEGKRSRLLELGVRAAFNSRSDSWYDDLMHATDGNGVDVVLNSLAGRHVHRCLEALRPGGWHCEIGKVDIYSDNSLGLKVFRRNLRFAAIDMDRLMIDDPFLSRELSEKCLSLLARGSVPPLPVTSFDYGDYAEALRLMMTGQHEGKLVLKSPPAPGDRKFPVVDRRPLLDADATYLVTGGLGGFGQRLLPYLVTAGARHLTLMDRDPERRRSEYWLRQSTTLSELGQGVEIDLVKCDVSDEADVRSCVANLKKPLKGVFHLAGTLDDCLLADMSAESISRVFAPKARGALNLHRATAGLELDHFVLMSSTSSTFGNPGQVNYSAANAFVDGLAAFRRRCGLPALAYNLAAVSDAGMAAKNLGVLRLMRAAGMPPVSSHFAIANLDFALRKAGDGDHIITALFKRLLWGVDSTDYLRVGRLIGNHDAFVAGSDEQMTVDDVMVKIAGKVAELCGHEEGEMEEPLSSFGLNSISVAELGAFIQSEFNFQASALELMTTASCRSLASAIVLGSGTSDAADADSGKVEPGNEPIVERRHIRRRPSEFASKLLDHFDPESWPEDTDLPIQPRGNAGPTAGKGAV